MPLVLSHDATGRSGASGSSRTWTSSPSKYTECVTICVCMVLKGVGRGRPTTQTSIHHTCAHRSPSAHHNQGRRVKEAPVPLAAAGGEPAQGPEERKVQRAGACVTVNMSTDRRRETGRQIHLHILSHPPFTRTHSYIHTHNLSLSPSLTHTNIHVHSTQWGKEHVLSSAHNEAGRGMELSELVNYNGCV